LLVTGLRERGHNVDVFLVEGGSARDSELLDGSVTFLTSARVSGLRGAWNLSKATFRLRRKLTSSDYDLVHAAMARGYVVASIARPMSIPLIAWRRNQGVHLQSNRLGYRIERWSAKRSIMLVFNSDPVKSHWLSRRVGAPDRCAVVSNALAEWRFDTAVEPALSGGPCRLASVGGLKHVKRHDLLIKAAKLLRDRGIDAEVVLVGDGDRREELVSLADELEVPLTVTGYVDDPRPWLASATAYVHSSDSEGSSNAIAEAMAFGMAIVATDVGDAKEALDGVGLVVPSGDPEALARALASFIVEPDKVLEMGRAARAAAELRFSVNQVVSAHEAIYAQVVSDHVRDRRSRRIRHR